MVFSQWIKNEQSKQEKFDADKKAIIDAVASGNHAAINAIVGKLQR